MTDHNPNTKIKVTHLNENVVVVYARSQKEALTILDHRTGMDILFIGEEVEKLRDMLNDMQKSPPDKKTNCTAL